MNTGQCKLCLIHGELKLSHFIPKFVGKWVKETSATGFIRKNTNVNKRVQDIEKEYWLCGSCEQLFSGWEREFANKVFYPLVRDEIDKVAYGDWLAKFCASLSWRTLGYMRSVNPRTDGRQNEVEEAALEALASFLLGRSSNPGKYEQHLFPLEPIDSTNAEVPPNVNRYFLRNMQMDILGTDQGEVIIYTKLPKFMVLGLTGHRESRLMRESRVSIREGVIKPRTYYWPTGFANYVFGKAREISGLYKTMNSSQHAMIEKALLKDPERAAASQTIAALRHDFDMFGEDVFMPRSPRELD